MKKKIVGLLMAVLAVCNMSMPAFAYQTQVVEEQEENQIEAEAKVYDDYLDGTVVTRSASKPKKLFDLSSGKYAGSLYRCMTGLYTNYYFKPNSAKKLYVGWSVYGHGTLDHETVSWALNVDLYDLTAKKTVDSHTTGYYSDMSAANTHTDSICFTGLNATHNYCVLFSCDETQVSGDIWVGHTE